MEAAESRSRPTAIDVIASVTVAFTLAVAQPLLDLTGRNAAFFVAHRSRPTDLVALAAALCFGLPLAVAAIVLATGRLRPRAGDVLHAGTLTLLWAALAVQVLKRLPGLRALPWPLVLAGAVVLGAGAARACRRATTVRGPMRWALALPALVAANFLLLSQASGLLEGESVAAARALAIERPARAVVVVVFDELPLASIADGRGSIDARLFPSFASLAREATWFRDATTVHAATAKAVPAILTGRAPRGDRLPSHRDHPQNLFTMLGSAYDVRASEAVTRLCPERICAVPDERAAQRWRSTASDLRWVLLHLLAPEGLASRLPPVDQNWRDFGAGDGGANASSEIPERAQEALDHAVAADRGRQFERFVDSVRPPARPTLWFHHSMLPHVPWIHLPDGRRFRLTASAGDLSGARLSPHAGRTAQAYQRHLLQVRYADRLLGGLVARLRSQGMWEDTLLVVVSDHGASFLPGDLRRTATGRNQGEIGPVPFFVKRPGRAPGGPSDRPVETIDVLPTIAHVLGVRSPWRFDGASAFGALPPRPRSRAIRRDGGSLRLEVGIARMNAVARRKYAMFAPSGPSVDLFRFRDGAALVGRAAPPGRRHPSITVRLDDARAYKRVRTRSRTVPALVAGRLGGRGASGARVAVAVNGVVRAVTVSTPKALFYAIVPPTSFRDGRNEVVVYLVGRSGVLVPLGEP